MERERRDRGGQVRKSVFVVLAVAVLVVAGCSLIDRRTTFEEISCPYLREYGEPEQVFCQTTGSAVVVIWRWPSVGFMVRFGWDMSESFEEDWIVIGEYPTGP